MDIKARTSKKIRAVMVLKGITGAELGRSEHVTRQAINHVVSGYRKTPRLRKAISRTLGIPASIWEEMDRELKAQKETSL
jgi:transcriptional regulator with XRE-family HTH domain